MKSARNLSVSYLRLADAIVALVCGLIALGIPRRVFASHSLRQLLEINGHLFQIAIGLVLIYVAAQLYAGRRRAWIISCVAMATLAVSTVVFHHQDIWKVVVFTLAACLLIATSAIFTVRSDDLSLRRGILRALLVFGAAILYGLGGFYVTGPRLFGHTFTLWQSLQYSVWQLISFQPAVLPAPLLSGRLFLRSIDLLSYVTFALVVVSLFKPIRFSIIPDRRDINEAAGILRATPHSSEDFFKIWPEDKRYFFSRTRKSFLAYTVIRSSALILDGGAGKKSEWPQLFRDFTAFARQNGWQPSVIHASGSLRRILHRLHYRRLYIGEEAMIDVARFAQTTARSKHFRYVTNRADREQLQVEFWNAPLTNEQVATLRTISDSWLSMRGRREYRFIMAPFTESYIRHCDVAVLRAGDIPVAYCNTIPSFLPDQRSLDHLRFTAELPQVGMHFLLKQVILHYKREGVAYLNLGLSPLSGDARQPERDTLPDRLLMVVKQLGSSLYSFSGLEQFKNKFDPDWRPRYIYYQPPAARLARIGTDLMQAVFVPRVNDRRTLALIGLGCIAALAYASFPLAYLLDISHDETGLVSLLGSTSAPYAWLFNSLDVLGGALLIAISYQLLKYYSVRQYRIIMASLIIAIGVTIIVAALAPIVSPHLVSLQHRHRAPTVIPLMHYVASILTSVFTLATVFVSAFTYRQRITYILFALLLASTAWSAYGVLSGVGVGISERVAIIMTSLSFTWVVIQEARR